ncbi:MAG: hypothetical protein Q4B26_14455 [Eubacteriales bacterium]|nr:hypothetical protein [Eubacteriales bacterium]
MGKYMKHECKNVSRTAGFALIYLAIITALFAFVTKVDLTVIPVLGIVITVLVSLIYVLSIAAISLAAALYIAIHFYRTIYGDEGYLTQMLPLTKHQIVFAKGAVSSLWLFLISLAGIASILIQFLVLSPSEFLEIVVKLGFNGDFWGEFAKFCNDTFHVSVPVFILLLVLLLLVLLVFAVNSLYASVALGQLWKNYPIPGAIIAYIVVNVLYTLLLVGFVNVADGTFMEFLPLILSFIAVHVLLDVATFFCTSCIMKYQLNMK